MYHTETFLQEISDYCKDRNIRFTFGVKPSLKSGSNSYLIKIFFKTCDVKIYIFPNGQIFLQKYMTHIQIFSLDDVKRILDSVE